MEGSLGLERKDVRVWPDNRDSADTESVIHRLEEIRCDGRTNYDPEVVPSEQGELLLEFIRRHLITKK